MSTSAPDDAAARALWASPGWLRLWTALMSGLRHDVTGRASALNSLSMVASRGLADSEMVTEELAREAVQLSDLARLLDGFPTAARRRGVGVSLSDVVSRLPDVLRMANDFSGVEVELDMPDTLPAAAIDPGPAAAAMLLLMAQALSESSSSACHIVGIASGATVSLTVYAIDASEGPSDSSAWLDEHAAMGISAMAQHWGGAFVADSAQRRYALTAPTL